MSVQAPVTNTITNEDCVAGMRRLPSGCIDLVFADPPFNIGYEYDQYNDHRSTTEYLRWSRDWTAEAVRLLKSSGTLWLAIGDEYAAELKMILQRRHKLFCRSWVIWYFTFGQHNKINFCRSHTHLLYMVKDRSNFTFNGADIRVPSARQLVYDDERANPDGRMPDNTWILRPQAIPDSFDPHDDTWYFPRVNGTFRERRGWHGCQMPEQLVGRIIRACSNARDVVLDPFVGSGTTMAVAKKLGRCYLGFELSAQYSRGAVQRVAAVHEGQPLDGADNPLQSGLPERRHQHRPDDDQLNLFE